MSLQSLWSRLFASLKNTPSFSARSIHFNGGASAAGRDAPIGDALTHCEPPVSSFPANVVRNVKYHILTFLPQFLYEQFSFFFNFYFLVVALSQFVPVLQIGFLFTYVAPLMFVLCVTMAKEGMDDLQRWRRDREANGQRYQRLRRRRARDRDALDRGSLAPGDGPDAVVEEIPSSDIRVGDVLILHTNQRVPADALLLRTHDRENGSVFIRTDQLDGEFR